MKRLNFFATLSVLTVFLFFSCGSDEKPTPAPEPPKPPIKTETTAITVEVEGNQTEIKKGETLTFVVKNQDGKVLENEVKIFVDTKEINGNSYKFEKAKYFYVYAKYKKLKSPKLKITVSLTPITIEVAEGKTEVVLGTTLSFIVRDDKNKELKENVFIYVNRIKIDGFSYKFTELKDHKVYAKYDGAKSQEITIKVNAPKTTHTAKVLLEDFTSVGCGYCPRVAGLIEDLKEEYPQKIIPIALHDNFNGKDPFYFNGVRKLRSAFNVNGFPFLLVDREESTEDENEILNKLKKYVNLGLAISSELADDKLKVKVKVHYEYEATEKNKLVVFLLESGLKADQANYYNNNPNSRYYRKGNPMKDFVHNHVARVALTSVLGDEIPADKTVKDAVYEKDLEITLPSSIKDSSKLTLVAFVVNRSKEVINVQEAKVGENKDFD